MKIKAPKSKSVEKKSSRSPVTALSLHIWFFLGAKAGTIFYDGTLFVTIRKLPLMQPLSCQEESLMKFVEHGVSSVWQRVAVPWYKPVHLGKALDELKSWDL